MAANVSDGTPSGGSSEALSVCNGINTTSHQQNVMQTSNSVTYAYFLDFPSEIRTMIYNWLYASLRRRNIKPYWHNTPAGKVRVNLDHFIISKAFYTEASEIFYSTLRLADWKHKLYIDRDSKDVSLLRRFEQQGRQALITEMTAHIDIYGMHTFNGWTNLKVLTVDISMTALIGMGILTKFLGRETVGVWDDPEVQNDPEIQNLYQYGDCYIEETMWQLRDPMNLSTDQISFHYQTLLGLTQLERFQARVTGTEHWEARAFEIELGEDYGNDNEDFSIDWTPTNEKIQLVLNPALTALIQKQQKRNRQESQKLNSLPVGDNWNCRHCKIYHSLCQVRCFGCDTLLKLPRAE